MSWQSEDEVLPKGCGLRVLGLVLEDKEGRCGVQFLELVVPDSN